MLECVFCAKRASSEFRERSFRFVTKSRWEERNLGTIANFRGTRRELGHLLSIFTDTL